MKASAPKCAHPQCARDGVKAPRGGHQRGRPPEGSPHLPKYCPGHYEQIRRGLPSAPLRAYGKTTRTDAYEDCATIAEFHGAPDLAALFRSLKSPRNASQTSAMASNSSEVEDSKE